METSRNLTEANLSESISSAEDSPAKISASPESEPESTVSEAGSGANIHGFLGCFDPGLYSLRTSQVCLQTNQCDEFSETFPRSGTMRNGRVYRRESLVSLTSVIESCWLPTIGKQEYKGSSRKRFKGSKHYRGAKMAEGLRTCANDPQYINPSFAEVVMGFPIQWTELGLSETPSSLKLPSGSGEE